MGSTAVVGWSIVPVVSIGGGVRRVAKAIHGLPAADSALIADKGDLGCRGLGIIIGRVDGKECCVQGSSESLDIGDVVLSGGGEAIGDTVLICVVSGDVWHLIRSTVTNGNDVLVGNGVVVKYRLDLLIFSAGVSEDGLV